VAPFRLHAGEHLGLREKASAAGEAFCILLVKVIKLHVDEELWAMGYW